MLHIATSACLGVSLLAVPALAQAPGPAGVSQYALTQQDRQFLDKAAMDNQGEIRTALLAGKQAEAPAVKAFARLMLDDHAALEKQLANVLRELQVPSSNGVAQEGARDLRQLEGVYGHAFDVQFMRAQVRDHVADVRDFTQQARTTRNSMIWALTANALPVLRQHLALAEAVERSLVQEPQQALAGPRR